MTAHPPRSLLIKNLAPGLPERGKIKIGVKGKTVTSKQGNEFQPPQKLDHFLITTTERGEDGNFVRDAAIHAKLGDKPKRIPILLLFDDIGLNFQSRYAAFKGRTLWCSGDGEVADRLKGDSGERERVTCPCPRIAPGYEGNDRCKFNGTLSALIEGAAAVGGAWKFRTTSYNTVVGLMSSLALIKRITGGPLAGIPLALVVSPKAAVDPKGKAQTVFIVSIEYAGDVRALQQEGHKIALEYASHHIRIEEIEREARALLTAPTALGTVFRDEDTDEVAHEFYPEAVAAEVNGNGGNGAQKPGKRLDALEDLIGTEDAPISVHTGEPVEVLPPEPTRQFEPMHWPSASDDRTTWVAAGKRALAEARALTTVADLEAWQEANAEGLALMMRADNDVYQNLGGHLADLHNKLSHTGDLLS